MSAILLFLKMSLFFSKYKEEYPPPNRLKDNTFTTPFIQSFSLDSDSAFRFSMTRYSRLFPKKLNKNRWVRICVKGRGAGVSNILGEEVRVGGESNDATNSGFAFHFHFK